MREPLPLLLDAIERDNDGFVLRLLNDPGLLGRIGGINKVDKDGCTALMNAIFKGKTDIAEKILSIEGIDITLTNNEGQTALMYASHFGNEEIVHALLLKLLSDQDKGLAKEIDRKDKQGDTALMMAVAMNHQNIIKLLLSKNSDINKENNAGVTPLIQAVFKSNREVLKILLDYEEIEISKYDKCHERGQTALQYAVLSEREDSKIVELILDSKKAHSIKDEDLHVALTVAIGLQYEKIIEKLCCFFNENNSNIINLVSHTGKTALMHAIQSGNTEIVKRLLSVKGIDINQMDTEGLTALSYVAQLQDHSKAQMIAEMLLSKREINIHLADHNGCIPLMHFADRGHCRIVEKLIKLMIQQEGDINCYDKEKNTALVRAIKGSHLYTVRALLPYSNPNIPANGGVVPLIQAVNYKDVTFEELPEMQQQGERFLKETKTAEVVFTGVGGKEIKLNTKAKLKGGSRVDVVIDRVSDVFSKKAINIIKELLDHPDIDINKQDDQGKTALEYATCNDRAEAVELILNSKHANSIDVKTIYLMFREAVLSGYVEVVGKYCDFLRKKKELDINMQDDKGDTLLMLAMYNYNYDPEKMGQIIRLLMLSGANSNIKNKGGWTVHSVANTIGNEALKNYFLPIDH